jgi:hypothetical protein
VKPVLLDHAPDFFKIGAGGQSLFQPIGFPGPYRGIRLMFHDIASQNFITYFKGWSPENKKNPLYKAILIARAFKLFSRRRSEKVAPTGQQ